jgi:hypothetical protein
MTGQLDLWEYIAKLEAEVNRLSQLCTDYEKQTREDSAEILRLETLNAEQADTLDKAAEKIKRKLKEE